MSLDTLRHFQTIFETGELVTSHEGVEIYRWIDPSANDRLVLTTIGMADRRLALRIELMMFCERHDLESLAHLLLDLVAYAEKSKPPLHWFHVLPLGRAVVPDSGLAHLLLTFPPFDIATFESGKNRVDVVWVIPISERERALFESEGVDALENRFEERNVSVADLFRSSVE